MRNFCPKECICNRIKMAKNFKKKYIIDYPSRVIVLRFSFSELQPHIVGYKEEYNLGEGKNEVRINQKSKNL